MTCRPSGSSALEPKDRGAPCPHRSARRAARRSRRPSWCHSALADDASGATLPVRLMNCHGGSARTQANLASLAPVRRFAAAAVLCGLMRRSISCCIATPVSRFVNAPPASTFVNEVVSVSAASFCSKLKRYPQRVNEATTCFRQSAPPHFPFPASHHPSEERHRNAGGQHHDEGAHHARWQDLREPGAEIAARDAGAEHGQRLWPAHRAGGDEP